MTEHEYESVLAELGSRAGLTKELLLTQLRDRDASMIQAIKALMHLFGSSLSESKTVASGHASWRAIHHANASLHEEAARLTVDNDDLRPREMSRGP